MEFRYPGSKKEFNVAEALASLQQAVIQCRRCPRLVQFREEVAQRKRRAYKDWEYWGKPVPSFGDPEAQVLVVGLAPAAHGANRTGRMFTGDRSGDLLYRALYETGFANQPTSVSRDDGLELYNIYISATIRCAPPGNKPLREEIENCREFLRREFELLRNVRILVALGRIAFDSCLALLKEKSYVERRSQYRFGHLRVYRFEDQYTLVCSYHPSQQNTLTGRLTYGMFLEVFQRVRTLVDGYSAGPGNKASLAGERPGRKGDALDV